MKWPEGVRKSGGGWRAVIMLDDGELLELGVWGLKPDAIEAYNWHLAWLSAWTGRCCRCQRDFRGSATEAHGSARDLLRHDPAGSEVSNYKQRKESKWLRT